MGVFVDCSRSSWERHLPSGTVTIAVYNPEFGISIPQEYAKRVSFLSPSVHDATVLLERVGFADVGSYTCKVSTFPLGNTQASTTVNVLVEPKVYVSAGPAPLLDGDAETVVATCVAERGRPAAAVSWETALDGRSEPATQDEANGTATVQAHYVWRPRSHGQGQSLTCVSRPWCRYWATTRTGMWVRRTMDGPMPDGVQISNYSFAFTRPLDRNDSGVYRCEVMNDIGLRSLDVHLWIQDPPPTTAAPTTTAAALHGDTSGTSTSSDQRRSPLTSPTLASLPDGSLGTVVGGAVGGVLLLALLLVLAAVCCMRQRRTFRGDYYTKQYLGPSDMQKESQLDVLQPHELQEVYGDKGSGGGGKGSSQDLKPKPGGGGDIIYPEYPSERKDRDDWGSERGVDGRAEDGYYPEHYKNSHNVHPCGPPVHSSTVNGSPYLPEDCYDNGVDSDYVSHMDGSVISRREWYV
ncbi:hypothetical protein CRUP_026953 [Coryphaenoides rupestris]|nr:hypothetical protein CRUP_026953 [Coryphaenoides rupestris]